MVKILKRLSLSILFTLFAASQGYAGKLDVLVGGFSLSAETSSQSDSTSGIGAYRVNYNVDMLRGMQLSLGYTVLMSAGIGGDLGFGFDLGFEYYPLTPTEQATAATDNSFLKINPTWRPLVGVGFVQRQFQSVSTNYAGFSISAGVERALDMSFDLKALVRQTMLEGPGTSTADETTFFLGITYPFSL